MTVDEMGNMFMVRQGHKSGPPTAMGSHLDTQPTGGRYDGILGIMAGLEALRTMNDHNVTTEYPVRLSIGRTKKVHVSAVDRRFGCMVWRCTARESVKLQDVKDGALTMKSELEKIGFLGKDEMQS